MSKNYKWWVVGMLWVVCFFNYADRQAFSAVLPALQKEFGFNDTQLGLLAAAFAWTYAAAAPFAGFIGDRVARKHLILGGCVFWSAITMLTGWCGKFSQIMTVRAMTGLGESFYFPAAMSMLSDYHGRKTRSLAFSLHQSAVYVGAIGGSWLGAWLAETHGWRTGFYVFGGVGIVLALVLYKTLREPARRASEDKEEAPAGTHGVVLPTAGEKPLGVADTLRVILSKPTALLLMLVFLGANFVATIFLTWTPKFLVDKFHFGLTGAGLTGAVYIYAASAISVPIGGLLADRWAAKMPGGRALVQATGLLIGSVFVALVGLTNSVTVLIAGMTLYGLCRGFYDSNIFASLYDVIEPRARATAAGIMNTVGWGGGALGPLFVGYYADHGRHVDKIANTSEAIAVGSIIYVVGAVLLLVVAFGTIKRDVIKSAPMVA